MRRQTKGEKRRVDKKTIREGLKWLRKPKEIFIDENRAHNMIQMLVGGRIGDDWTDATEYALMGFKFKTNGEPR